MPSLVGSEMCIRDSIMNDSFVSTNQNTEIDSINSYFECITECSIVDGHQECLSLIHI